MTVIKSYNICFVLKLVNQKIATNISYLLPIYYQLYQFFTGYDYFC